MSISAPVTSLPGLPVPAHVLRRPALNGQFVLYSILPTKPRDICFTRHDFYKIGLYTGGTLVLRYGSQVRPLQAPCLIVYSILQPYTTEHEPDLTGFDCLFRPEFMGASWRKAFQDSPLFDLRSDPVYPLDAAALARFTGLFARMLTEVEATDAYQAEMLRTYAEQVIVEALRLRAAPVRASEGAPARLATQFLRLLEQQFPVLSLLEASPLTRPAQYADCLHVHPNHLNRAVRQLTGQSIRQHLAARFGQEAQALLRYSEWSIGEIAHSLGFATPHSFHRFYRQQFGSTPQAYRRQVSTPA